MKTKFLQAATIIAGFTLFFALPGCKKDGHYQEPDTLDNFDATLFSTGGKMISNSGLIKFRQDPDTARIATLDTYVINLEPNHSYLLQRAVNPVADTTGCSSTAWLTLGLGTQPQAIHTNSAGAGHTQFWRALTAVARGTTFHIHFQIVDSITLEPVLMSDCHDFSVQ